MLKNKVAVVIGASRGIGYAIAEAYAVEGAKVVIASRSEKSLEAAAAQIRDKGGDVLCVPCDAGDRAQVRSVIDRAAQAHGRIDVLVNNAQSFGTRADPQPHNPSTPLEALSEDEFNWVFSTGFTGTLTAMQAVFPHMKRQGGGSIINFGSHRGIISTPGTAAYNVTKEAIRSLTRTAANEWGAHGIRVNTINPIIETDAFVADVPDPAHRQQYAQTAIPLRYLGQPADCARVAVFLAGPDSAYLTGMTFTVDGGVASFP